MDVVNQVANNHQENHGCGPLDGGLDLPGGTPLPPPPEPKQVLTP